MLWDMLYSLRDAMGCCMPDWPELPVLECTKLSQLPSHYADSRWARIYSDLDPANTNPAARARAQMCRQYVRRDNLMYYVDPRYQDPRLVVPTLTKYLYRVSLAFSLLALSASQPPGCGDGRHGGNMASDVAEHHVPGTLRARSPGTSSAIAVFFHSP